MPNSINILPVNLTVAIKMLNAVFPAAPKEAGGIRGNVRVDVPESPGGWESIVNDFYKVNKRVVVDFVMYKVVVVKDVVGTALVV